METEPDIIAERILTFAPGDERPRVQVLIGRPYGQPSQTHFCPYQILGIGKDETKRAGGVDGIQAIQLALVLIGAELSQYSAELKWDDETSTGFPISVNDPVFGIR